MPIYCAGSEYDALTMGYGRRLLRIYCEAAEYDVRSDGVGREWVEGKGKPALHSDYFRKWGVSVKWDDQDASPPSGGKQPWEGGRIRQSAAVPLSAKQKMVAMNCPERLRMLFQRYAWSRRTIETGP